MASAEESKRSDSGSKIPAAMEVSTTPSSWLSEEQNEDEEQVPENPLISAEAPAPFASGSATGGGNDDAVEHMFDKVLTSSDVGKLNRLVIPKQHAQKYFPLEASANEKGLVLSFEDRSGKVWRFRYSYWNSSQSYVVTKGWSRFVKEKRLDAGDTISFSRGAGEATRGRLFIDCKRRRRTELRGEGRSLRLNLEHVPLPLTFFNSNRAAEVVKPVRFRLFGVNIIGNPQQNRDLEQTEGE